MVAETVKLTVDGFGTVENHITKQQDTVKRFTWTNGNNVSVQVSEIFFRSTTKKFISFNYFQALVLRCNDSFC